MLTRSKLKRGEGSLEEYNLEIGSRCAMALSKEGNPFDPGKTFLEAFMIMKTMVEEMYKDQKKAKEESTLGTVGKCKGVGGGGDHLKVLRPLRFLLLLLQVQVLFQLQ